MKASTEESQHETVLNCTNSQLRTVEELVNAITGAKILASEVYQIKEGLKSLTKTVDDNDKKHEASAKALNEALLNSNTQTNLSLATLNATIAPMIPYIEKAAKVQSLSNKWSPILCVVLIAVILVTSKAAIIFEAYKKVFL